MKTLRSVESDKIINRDNIYCFAHGNYNLETTLNDVARASEGVVRRIAAPTNYDTPLDNTLLVT